MKIRYKITAEFNHVKWDMINDTSIPTQEQEYLYNETPGKS